MNCISSSVDLFIEHCRVSKRLSLNTLRAYSIDFDNFQAVVGGDLDVAAVDREVLRHYARTLFDVQGLKESSVKRRMAALKVMFRWLEREEVIALSPFHRLDMPIRLPQRLPRALTVDEMRRLLRLVESDRDNGHDGAMMYFAVICLFVTGLRVGELTGALLADLDRGLGSILVRGKGNRERRVYLSGGEAAEGLDLYLVRRSLVAAASPHLLVDESGGAVTAQTLRRRLLCLGQRARIERRVTPHMLRHTAATQLIEAGVDIRFVQKLLGHASIATTQIYTQVSDSSLRDTISRADTLGRVKGGRGG